MLPYHRLWEVTNFAYYLCPLSLTKKKEKKKCPIRRNWHETSGRVLTVNGSNHELQGPDGWVGHGLISDLRPSMPTVSQALFLVNYVQL